MNMGNKSVFIVGGRKNYPDYATMFQANGWDVVDSIDDCDMLQFVGGEDVTPQLYNHYPHKSSSFNPVRDLSEVHIFNTAAELRLPMAGICRGGQFLNVMCFGEMFQDATNHTGSHTARDLDSKEDIMVSSTHHQIMKPHENGIVLMVASQYGRKVLQTSKTTTRTVNDNRDVEAVYYDYEKCLCFQPHPEFFNKTHECQKLYFTYINKYLFDGVD